MKTFYGLVYRLTNMVNGKVYIGQTKGTLESRWDEHVRQSRKTATGSSPKLHNAMAKHGPEMFEKEILGHSCTPDGLNWLEIEMIALHESTNNELGYNISAGGVTLDTPETRAKKSATAKAKGIRPPAPTPEQRAAVGKANSERMKGVEPVWASAARAMPVEIDGVTYPTREAAAAALGISVKTLRARLAGTGGVGHQVTKVKYKGVVYNGLQATAKAADPDNHASALVLARRKLRQAGLEISGDLFDADEIGFDLFPPRRAYSATKSQ